MYQGRPTNNPFVSNQEDLDSTNSPGGGCITAIAHQALKFGDVVYWHIGGRVDKSLESALYTSFLAGVVVGGKLTDYQASNDKTNLNDIQVAAVGERVIIQQRGICYAKCDATGIKLGSQISPGRTTAGRVRGDLAVSCAWSMPGLVIKAGASAIVKAANVTQTLVAGLLGTPTAANLDQAALAGTVTNAKYNVYVFRVAANGTTVTSAMGTEGASIADIVWPVGVPTVAALGCVLIHPTGTGNFVGGTTALDDATVVPNAVYYDFVQTSNNIGTALEDGGAAATAVKILLSL